MLVKKVIQIIKSFWLVLQWFNYICLVFESYWWSKDKFERWNLSLYCCFLTKSQSFCFINEDSRARCEGESLLTQKQREHPADLPPLLISQKEFLSQNTSFKPNVPSSYFLCVFVQHPDSLLLFSLLFIHFISGSQPSFLPSPTLTYQSPLYSLPFSSENVNVLLSQRYLLWLSMGTTLPWYIKLQQSILSHWGQTK